MKCTSGIWTQEICSQNEAVTVMLKALSWSVIDSPWAFDPSNRAVSPKSKNPRRIFFYGDFFCKRARKKITSATSFPWTWQVALVGIRGTCSLLSHLFRVVFSLNTFGILRPCSQDKIPRPTTSSCIPMTHTV